MSQPIDWLSRLLEIMPVSGRLELRCLYGAPWQVVYGQSAAGDIVYHVVLSGVAMVNSPDGGPQQRLTAGDILLVPTGAPHILHDGGGEKPVAARQRVGLNLTISENAGPGERLDMLCGRFTLAPPHDRLLGAYLRSRLIVRGTPPSATTAQTATREQLTGLVALMRAETGIEGLGGHAMLNAFSTALFALTLRLASESEEVPPGLLALAAHTRLAPALTAMFLDPARSWTLPDLASLCHMSRATLARHFQNSLGRSASELLLDIRMTLATNELKNPHASTAAVAETAGYRSEAAFQRAFKQHLGMTPAQWRASRRAVKEK
ncbi:MAG: AraC family transcriptional regulator [Rhizobiaceae bacterium]|nr:AraC family transcriptional regulator [Rhizobiaceae bacterium]